MAGPGCSSLNAALILRAIAAWDSLRGTRGFPRGGIRAAKANGDSALRLGSAAPCVFPLSHGGSVRQATSGLRGHFHEAEAPSEEELLGLATQTYTNAVRWLRRHGHLADATRAARADSEDVPLEALQGCAEIAMQRGSFAKATAEGHDNAASRKRRFPSAKSRFVAEREGFNVHAAVHIPLGDDLGLVPDGRKWRGSAQGA
jgi:hypothetical protein